MTAQAWLRKYTMLVLRLDRILGVPGRGWSLDYLGPESWRAEALAEPLPSIDQLAEDAGALLADLPFARPRSTYVAAHARALRALVRRETGAGSSLPELVRD